ncbi:MAG TPA: glycosyltransferase family 4 protein [Chthoniobacterales bacterium]|jgi:glycosyltransferase involved in cell wall biosynthesis
MIKRVLMTADAVGGVWTYALELMRALPEIEFALATMGKPVSREQGEELSAVANATLFPSNFALEWMDAPWAEVDRAGDWLLEVARDFNPDLVHLNGYAHAALRWERPILVVAHSCVLSWWSAVKKGDAPAQFDEYRCRVAAGLNAADLVVAPTQAMLDTLAPNYRFFGPARAIPNAREAGQFSPAAKRSAVFAAGRLWDEAKNITALAAAAERLPWPVEIAGDAVDPSGRTIELRNVVSLGRLSSADLAERLATSAIYALPARYEPFGLSALEAALAGCALVLGEIPSLREVWGDAAIFVDPDDHDALAAALNYLIENKAARLDYAARARLRAALYSPARMAGDYRDAYRECVSRRTSEVAA